MPIFKVEFEREYTITEGFTRYVEAADRNAAFEACNRLAREFDNDCPDDLHENGNGPGAESFSFRVGDDCPPPAVPFGYEVLE